MERSGLDSYGLRLGPVAVYCEHVNERDLRFWRQWRYKSRSSGSWRRV